MALTDKLTVIADAVREKTGKTDALTLDQMVTAIEGIPSSDLAKSIIERTATEISDDTVTSIAKYAFYYNTNVKSVNFQSVTNIVDSAFYGSALESANFPAAISIGKAAFWANNSLVDINFPVATSIGASAFAQCYALTSADFPMVTSIGDSAFSLCKALTNVHFPVATSIGGSFNGCNSLTSVVLPMATSIGRAFASCAELVSVDLPVATSIGSWAFEDSPKLSAVILRNDAKFCRLENINAFENTPIASGTGYIYVPRALLVDGGTWVNNYSKVTNWSNFASQFRALEDYTVDGTTTGELDPAKTGVTA